MFGEGNYYCILFQYLIVVLLKRTKCNLMRGTMSRRCRNRNKSPDEDETSINKELSGLFFRCMKNTKFNHTLKTITLYQSYNVISVEHLQQYFFLFIHATYSIIKYTFIIKLFKRCKSELFIVYCQMI